jgi:hypothetical protein
MVFSLSSTFSVPTSSQFNLSVSSLLAISLLATFQGTKRLLDRQHLLIVNFLKRVTVKLLMSESLLVFLTLSLMGWLESLQKLTMTGMY